MGSSQCVWGVKVMSNFEKNLNKAEMGLIEWRNLIDYTVAFVNDSTSLKKIEERLKYAISQRSSGEEKDEGEDYELSVLLEDLKYLQNVIKEL